MFANPERQESLTCSDHIDEKLFDPDCLDHFMIYTISNHRGFNKYINDQDNFKNSRKTNSHHRSA